MSYKLLQDGYVKDLIEGWVIPPGHYRYRLYEEWLAAGNTPEPADPPPPPPADWRGFLAALRGTTVFSDLRVGARTDVATNALATELRTTLGEAALGLVEPQVIQGLLDELLPSLTPPKRTEIGDLITQFNIPLTV